MSQTTWTRLAGPGTLVAPALSALGWLRPWHVPATQPAPGCLYAAVVSPGGDVVTAHTAALDDWSPWTVVGSTSGYPALPASANTSPVLARDGDDSLLLLCRSADDNLYLSRCRSGAAWNRWQQLTDDGSVSGRISATITESPWRLHVLYSGPGRALHYRSFDSAWSTVSATSWPGVRDGVLTSDGSGEVFAAHRLVSDRMTFLRLQAPWNGPWQRVVTPAGKQTEYDCLSLSNAVYHAGAFHVLFLWRTRRDVGYHYGIRHVRIRAQQCDDAHFTSVFDHIGVEPHAPQATLASYRNRLVAAFNDGSANIRYAWLDDIDPSNRWIGREIVASGQTTDRIALAECNFRIDDKNYFNNANYGWDLFALVRGKTGRFVYFIYFSRTFLKHRLHSISHGVKWCTEYPTPMAECKDEPMPSIEETPVFTEIGAGTMGMPDELMKEIFPRVMKYRRKAGQDYMAWVHNEPGRGGHGPDINVSTQHLSDTWHEEMLHCLLSNMRVVDAGAGAAVTRNQMWDLISDSAVAEGIKLFGQHTNGACDCRLGMDGQRCRGFAYFGGTTNYDVQTRQHSFIGVISRYLRTGQLLRDYAYSDRRAGIDLLWEKYCWVRKHMFGGVEFGEWYTPIQVVTIRNVHSGKVLDVRGWNLEDHAPLQQHAFHGGDNQRFHLRPLPAGYIQIVAMHSGKALDVAGVSTDDGATVQQYSRSAGPNQQWRLVPDGTGSYSIVAQHSGKCLEVVNWSTLDGGGVAQYDCHGGDNQKWTFEE